MKKDKKTKEYKKPEKKRHPLFDLRLLNI